jgi:hypothetical protein
MSPEGLPPDNKLDPSHLSERDADAPASEDENRESIAKATIIAKQEIAGHWALVGLSHFYFPPAHNIKVSLPNGRDRWLNVSASEFSGLHEGETISLLVKPWERAEYALRISEIVEHADSFDDLKAGFRSLNVSDQPSRNNIDDLLALLDDIEKGAAHSSESATYMLIPDVPGLKEKIAALKAGSRYPGIEESADPTQLPNEILLTAYKEVQAVIRDLIAKRDSFDHAAEEPQGANVDDLKPQERIQRRIEEAFAVLGSYRQVIDKRGLNAKTMGELDL